jgi:Tol biopolymer transport system component
MLQSLVCALGLLLAGPPAEDALSARLRALATVGMAEVPRPSRDGARLAFVTTLFGSRQVAVMPVDGGYPVQLTAEPEGVVSLRYSPADPRQLAAVVRRDGRRRVVLLDDQGGLVLEVDRAPGDQLLGGFTRDGKRLFFATLDAGKARLFQLQLDGKKVVEVLPGAIAAAAGPLPPPFASTPGAAQPDAGPPDAGTPDAGTPDAGTPDGGASSGSPQARREPTVALAEILPSVSSLGPASPDGRFLLLLVSRGGGDDLYSVEISSARATLLTPHEGKAHFAHPRWNPDGKIVYLLSDAGRPRDGVDAIAVATRERKTLYAPQRRVEDFAVTEDGHRIAVAEDESGETVFGLLELPSLRAQPLPQPPSGALAEALDGEPALAWNTTGDRLFFSWRQADDTTDVLAFRIGYGATSRLTRSPRPGLPPGSLPRPVRAQLAGAAGKDVAGWLWRPAESARPHLALVVTGGEVRPVLDARIDALVAAGIAVLGLNPRDASGRLEVEDAAPDLLAAVRTAQRESDLDAQRPLLVALGKGAAQAVRLVRGQPDAFAGIVTMDASERVPGATSVSGLADLVKAAREKLR